MFQRHEEGKGDGASKALGFHKKLMSQAVYLMLHHLLDMMIPLSKLSAAFQKRDMLVGDICAEVDKTVATLEMLKRRYV